jgi:3-oxoacyl-[acyl-carrier protein] reductase
MQRTGRPVALVTGASRTNGIGAAIARHLAEHGWDVATTYWTAYDRAHDWSRGDPGPDAVVESIEAVGARAFAIEADLAEPTSAARVFAAVDGALGPVQTLVLNHCEGEPVGLLDVSVEALERHVAVNVSANLLLIQEFARRFPTGKSGAIVALTSDHTAGNVPYGVTKGALERLITAAAVELAPLGIRANAVNPGGTDTGWMSEEARRRTESSTPLGRVGTPDDAARLVEFLCSDSGGWITGQLLFSNGGRRMTTH